MLIALALVLQALRLVIPLPHLASAFIIGTLMHLMLTLAATRNGRPTALLMGALLPLFAYLQGQIIISVLVPVVAMGNFSFVLAVAMPRYKWFAPVLKTILMAAMALSVLALFGIDNNSISVVVMSLCTPQLVTGLAGILLAEKVGKRMGNR